MGTPPPPHNHTTTPMGTAVLAMASLATTAASTGLSFYGQRQQAKSARYTAEYNAKVVENEARNRQLEAAESQKRMRQQGRRQMADLRNNLAYTGVLTTTGTAVDTLAEHAANLDVMVKDAARESRIHTDSLYEKAAMIRWESRQRQQAAKLASYGTIFSGVSQMATSANDFFHKGTLGTTRSGTSS